MIKVEKESNVELANMSLQKCMIKDSQELMMELLGNGLKI